MKSWKLLGASMAVLAVVACESPEEKAVKFAENAQEYLDEGELDRARLQFANALKADPNNVEALRGAAEVAEQEERYGAQLRYLRRLSNLEPNDIDVQADIARLNLLSGEVDNALEKASLVLENDPDNLDALTIKGAALVLQNNLDAASETLEQALSQAPENTEVRNLLAARYVRDEDYNRAAEIIEEGLEADPDNEALLVVKLLLSQRRQDIAEMGDTFERLIEVSPENGLYRERYARFVLAADGDLDKARENFEAAIPLLESPTDAVGKLIGIIRRQEGDEAAEARLREIVAGSDNEDLLFAVPAFLCEVGETERCTAELTRLADAEEVSPDVRRRARVQLGERAFAAGEIERAESFADAVIGVDADNPGALILKGKIQLSRNDAEEAIQSLRVALNSSPSSEPALILLGLAYEANGRAAFGEAQLAQAIDRVGLSERLFEAYRGMLVRNGKSEEAADLTLRFAQTSEATPQVQRESAGVLIGQGRNEEAEVVARGLLRSDPNDKVARRLLATSLMQQARFEEGLEEVDKLDAEALAEPGSIQLRAQLLNRLERTDELRSFLNEAATAGNSDAAYTLLTQFELNQGNNEAAVSAAQQAVSVFPDRESLWLSLYNAQLASGEREAASQTLVDGIGKAENTSNLRILRANQLLQENQREGARDVLMSLREDGALNDLAANNLAALMLDLGGDQAEALEIAKRFEGTEQPFFADTLAWAYFRNGDLEKAAEYSEIAAGTETPNAEIYYHRGVIAAARGETETAREAFNQALEAPGKTDAVSEDRIRTALDEL